jgi:D-aminopeptidase
LAAGGFAVGALAAVNAAGSAVIGDGPWFWAAPYEQDGEFGGHGLPAVMPAGALATRTKGAPRMNTTLVMVATDAALTKGQARHLAVMAQDGVARAIHPVHTALDGDVVFAAATGRRALTSPPFDLTAIGSAAAIVVARAIARAIYEARALTGAWPAYRDRFPA